MRSSDRSISPEKPGAAPAWWRWANLPFLAVIYAYRFTLSPFLGGQCRFLPTCSLYGLEAYRTHGPIRGTALTLRRVLRCHPWGGHGWDPVPLREEHATDEAEHTRSGQNR